MSTCRHAKLRNMFFVGASAMPGTGVPVVCAGSGVVADMVDDHLSGRAWKKSQRRAYTLLAFLMAIQIATAAYLYAL
jgi:phytoene desaturase (3,4-didehydrolycopene-forming)